MACAIFLLASLALSVQGAPPVLTLDNFDSPRSLSGWDGPITLGSASAAAVFADHKTEISFAPQERNWSGYDCLAFDVYSNDPHIRMLSLRLYDEAGGDRNKAGKYDYFDADRKIMVIQGWNHVEVRLHNLQAASYQRAVALDRVLRLVLSARGESLPWSIRLSDIRLVKGLEALFVTRTAHPGDLLTIIDNRWFVTRQVARPEDVPESPQIANLRVMAERESAELRDTIRVAQMQGIDTIYAERRLVVSDLGLKVRPLLAWFNNDREKEKMFRYVADACRDERYELEERMNGVHRLPETDDTQLPQPLIPPLPTLRNRPISGWFFRDEHNEPLMVLSLHSPSRALQRFFASPLQHIESYSVGGGSRWTIDDSPVYEAFKKYPDAHRVGWDGWCGHLIRDLDSMGGTKKENVVICLESKHVRSAIEEYIRINVPKLRSNPELMYNILAYELTYICYCDESRRMFSQWLEAKHHRIETANALWGTRYKSFADVVPPPTKDARPLPGTNRALWYDWARFNQDRFTQHLLWVRDTVRKYDSSTPLAAGGSSSMLSGGAGVSGIDEERIVNEVDDVIIHEGGGSTLGLDLQVALSEKKKPVADPEMSLDSIADLLPQILHGKSVVQLYHWPSQPASEFISNTASSLAHSWKFSLQDIDELLRAALDVRRLHNEMAAFVEQPAQVAILYSQTSTIQIPPEMVRWEATPYLHELQKLYRASQFLDTRITFVTERQIEKGRLSSYKLLLIPGAQSLPAGVVHAIWQFAESGGQVFISPESMTVDEYNHPRNYLGQLGIGVREDRQADIRASSEQVQRYDQTFAQLISYSNAPGPSLIALPQTPFASLGTLATEGSRQVLQTNNSGRTLFRFPDGNAAIAAFPIGKGKAVYSAVSMPEKDYWRFLDVLFDEAGVIRDFKVHTWNVEARAAKLGGRQLMYLTNFNKEPVSVRVQNKRAPVTNFHELRRDRDVSGDRVTVNAGETVILEARH
jgi:beta-galactosidase GanA